MRSDGQGVPHTNWVNPSGLRRDEEGVGEVGALASSRMASNDLVWVWRSRRRDFLEASRVLRDGCEPCSVDWFGLSVVGALAPHTCRRSFFEAGGSARGAVSVYVGAGTRGADVALVGDLVGSGIGVAGAGNGCGWGHGASWGVGVGTRRQEGVGMSR